MLKAVIVDSNAISRGLLNTVLADGGYEVVAQAHTGHTALVQAAKFRPQIMCIAREQVEDGSNVVEQLRANLPKTLVFMVSGTLDAPTIEGALARGVHGFIVKPFRADAVLKTIRNTVIAVVRKQQAGSSNSSSSGSGDGDASGA
jgi:two-component system chemotaxis response regulator CheY